MSITSKETECFIICAILAPVRISLFKGYTGTHNCSKGRAYTHRCFTGRTKVAHARISLLKVTQMFNGSHVYA